MDTIASFTTQLYQKFTSGVYWQFFKFALAGAICATIEMGILIGLKSAYGEANLLIFNAIGYGIAVIINYLISRTFVFERGKYSGNVEFLAFVGVATIGLGLNQLVFYIGLQQLGNAYYIVAKLVAIIIVVIWNFFAKKNLVFKG